MHTHPFGAPSYRNLLDKIRTVPDLVGFRMRGSVQRSLTEEFVDFTNELIQDMDRHGIQVALMQPTGGTGSNELVITVDQGFALSNPRVKDLGRALKAVAASIP